jgi:hypothetical protein
VTVAGLAALSWIALASAHAGRFAPRAAIAAGVLAGVVVAVAAARTARAAKPDPRRMTTDAVAVALALAGALALAPAARPLPAFFDSSWYQNAALAIRRYEALEWTAEALVLPEMRAIAITSLADESASMSNVPSWPDRGFHAVAFASADPESALVSPYHPPLVSAAMAVVPGGGISIVLLWAFAYLLALASVARAAFGPPAAVVAVAVVAVMPSFAYYGSTPYAEIPAGALVLAGLACAVHLAWRSGPAPRVAFAAGMLLGLGTLAKVELGAVLAVVAVWWLAGRRAEAGAREGAAFLAGAALPLTHLALLAAGPSRMYMELNLAGVLGLLGLTPPIAAGLASSPKRLSNARLVGVVMVLGTTALVSASLLAPAAEGTIPPTSAVLVWFVTPLVLWAAAACAARCLKEAWPGGEAVLGPVFVIAALLVLVPGVTAGLSPLYTARRFVPLVIPGLAVLAAGAATAVVGWVSPAGRRLDTATSRWTALASGALIALALAALWVKSAPLRTLREFEGGRVIIDSLARRIPDDALVLFPSPLTGSRAGRLAAPLWTVHGRTTAVLDSSSPSSTELAAALDAWTDSGGGPVYFVGDDLGEWPLEEHWEATLVEREQWVAPIPAQSPELPPGPGTIGVELVLARVESAGAADGR